MAEYYHELLLAVSNPDEVFIGGEKESIALREIEGTHHIVVVYKETGADDGFIITAFKTSKPETFRRGEQAWP